VAFNGATAGGGDLLLEVRYTDYVGEFVQQHFHRDIQFAGFVGVRLFDEADESKCKKQGSQIVKRRVSVRRDYEIGALFFARQVHVNF